MPSPLIKENNLPPIIYFYVFFSSFLIDRFIFYNLRWLELFFIIYTFYSASSASTGYGYLIFYLGSYLRTEAALKFC